MQVSQSDRPPICHQSINSRAAVLFEIRKSELNHWFNGLKTAEVAIQSKAGAIAHFAFKVREQSRKIRAKQRELDSLKSSEQEPTPEQHDRIEKLEDDIAMARYQHQRSAFQLRDAQMEQGAAQGERDRIIGEHPEAELCDYDELQEIYSPIALADSQARWIAARVWATANGLNAEVGAALFDLPPGAEPGQRQYALRKELEIRQGSEAVSAVFRAIEIIAHLPAKDIEAILIESAQALLAKQLLGEKSDA